MKFVVSWSIRAGGTPKENEEATEDALRLFARWVPEPALGIHQILGGIDGRTGFAVVETEDPLAIARTTAYFSPHLEYTVVPVVDLPQMAEAAQAAVQQRASSR